MACPGRQDLQAAGPSRSFCDSQYREQSRSNQRMGRGKWYLREMHTNRVSDPTSSADYATICLLVCVHDLRHVPQVDRVTAPRGYPLLDPAEAVAVFVADVRPVPAFVRIKLRD